MLGGIHEARPGPVRYRITSPDICESISSVLLE